MYVTGRATSSPDDISDEVETILTESAKLQTLLRNRLKGKDLLKKYNNFNSILKHTIDCIKELNLPMVRPNAFDLTDGGPGVSVTNHEVKYRAAERFRIHNLDSYLRTHIATADQGRNIAERKPTQPLAMRFVMVVLCPGIIIRLFLTEFTERVLILTNIRGLLRKLVIKMCGKCVRK